MGRDAVDELLFEPSLLCEAAGDFLRREDVGDRGRVLGAVTEGLPGVGVDQHDKFLRAGRWVCPAGHGATMSQSCEGSPVASVPLAVRGQIPGSPRLDGCRQSLLRRSVNPERVDAGRGSSSGFQHQLCCRGTLPAAGLQLDGLCGDPAGKLPGASSRGPSSAEKRPVSSMVSSPPGLMLWTTAGAVGLESGHPSQRVAPGTWRLAGLRTAPGAVQSRGAQRPNPGPGQKI